MFCPSAMIVNGRYGYITCHTGCDYNRTPRRILWNPLRWEVGIGRRRPCAIRINKGGRAFILWANFRYRFFKTAGEREIVRRLAFDVRTGRPFGDHGTALNAVEFIVERREHTPGEEAAFLAAWLEGRTLDEWPDYYAWLRNRERNGLAPWNRPFAGQRK